MMLIFLDYMVLLIVVFLGLVVKQFIPMEEILRIAIFS